MPSPTSGLLRSRLRLFGVGLICGKVALVPLVFDPASDAPFVVPKALLSHALAYVLGGVMVGLAIQFGRSLFVRNWLHVPVLAFLAVNVAATILAADQVSALYGEHSRMVGLGTIADGVLLYFAVVLLVRTRTEAIAVIASGLGAAVVVLLYEFVQLAARDPFRWSVNGAVRPFSAIGQSTNLGLYVAVVVVVAAACALLAPRLARWLRACLLILSAVALAGLVITQTRSGLLGLLTGFGLLLLLTFIGYPDRRARPISLAAAAAATAVLGLVLFFTPLGARVLTTVQLPEAGANAETDPRLEQSADVRLALYRVAFDMVRERPLLGYGPDDFAVGLAKYRGENEPFEVQHGLTTSAHSWVAHVAAGSGVLGLLSFLTIAAYALWLTIRAGFRPVAWIGAGLLAAWLGAALTTVNAISTDWLFWAGIGAIGAATGAGAAKPVDPQAPPRARNSGPIRTRSDSRGFVPVACAAFGVVLALTTFTAFDASRLAQASEGKRLSSGGANEAIDLGLRATGADPQRAEYWHTLGLAYVQADKLKEAASAFDQAIRLAPYDIRHLGDLARAEVLLARAGDASMVARAREVADRAVRADPNNPQAHVTRAVVMQGTGNLPEALISINRALELEPISSLVEVYRTATQVLLGLGRKDEAIAMGRRGVHDLVLPQDAALIRIELARALAANGQLTEAINELDLVLAVRPNDPTATQLKAQIRGSLPPQ